LTKKDFQKYRDERLAQVADATTVKELNLWHALIEHAWALQVGSGD
jgi:hypothetical protein